MLIAKAWNKSNISSVLSIKKEKVLEYNLNEILKKLDKCIQDLKNE